MRHRQGDPEKLKTKFWTALADSPVVFLQLDRDSASAIPMSPQLDKDADSAIWFFTHKQNALAALGPATATFESKGHDIYARFHGNLAVETSEERFDRFWSTFVEAWYEGGRSDPNILLLRMDLGKAEIWDGDMGLFDTARMALGMNVREDASEQHAETRL